MWFHLLLMRLFGDFGNTFIRGCGDLGMGLFGAQIFEGLARSDERDRSRSTDGKARQQKHNFKDIHVVCLG